VIPINIHECSTCGTRFNDTDNSAVCPAGHEPPDEPDDDWPVSEVTI
jgi:hypothetical protein